MESTVPCIAAKKITLLLLIVLATPLTSTLAQDETDKAGTLLSETLPGHAPMPDLLVYESYSQTPVFVSAEKAVLPSGELDVRLFGGENPTMLSHFLSKPQEDGCIRMEVSGGHDKSPASHTSLKKALKSTDNVIFGRIVGRSVGFREGLPGALLRVETEEVLKGSARDEKFLFFPVANLPLGEKILCAGSSMRQERSPRMGEKILVILHDYWWNDKFDLIRAGAKGVILMPKEGSVLMAPAFLATDSNIANLSAEQFLALLR